jgi:hypothetical protein
MIPTCEFSRQAVMIGVAFLFARPGSGGKYCSYGCVRLGYSTLSPAGCVLQSQDFTMSGPHYISVSSRRAPRRAARGYLSPGDVAAFRAAILAAGYALQGLLSCEFPRAELVSDALYAVTNVVGMYGLSGRWVTSWVSSARSEFLATSEVREVGAGVTIARCVHRVSYVSHIRLLFRLLCRR